MSLEGRPLGPRRHAGRHRAVLDRHRVRPRRGARRDLEPRARPRAGRQRPGRVRALHPRGHGPGDERRGRRRATSSTGSSPRSSRRCPGGRVPSSCWPSCARPGSRCGLVTMSYQRFVAPILAGLPPETFRVIVTGDQVERGKPHPEAYLTAAAALGFDPGECVAIEDSNTGATSAEAAGCPVLVVREPRRRRSRSATHVRALADRRQPRVARRPRLSQARKRCQRVDRGPRPAGRDRRRRTAEGRAQGVVGAPVAVAARARLVVPGLARLADRGPDRLHLALGGDAGRPRRARRTRSGCRRGRPAGSPWAPLRGCARSSAP